jgi:site-specific recombinase
MMCEEQCKLKKAAFQEMLENSIDAHVPTPHTREYIEWLEKQLKQEREARKELYDERVNQNTHDLEAMLDQAILGMKKSEQEKDNAEFRLEALMKRLEAQVERLSHVSG